jgi:hypothetical protein
MSTKTSTNDQNGYFQYGRCGCGKPNSVFWMSPEMFLCKKCALDMAVGLLQDVAVVELSEANDNLAAISGLLQRVEDRVVRGAVTRTLHPDGKVAP